MRLLVIGVGAGGGWRRVRVHDSNPADGVTLLRKRDVVA